MVIKDLERKKKMKVTKIVSINYCSPQTKRNFGPRYTKGKNTPMKISVIDGK